VLIEKRAHNPKGAALLELTLQQAQGPAIDAARPTRKRGGCKRVGANGSDGVWPGDFFQRLTALHPHTLGRINNSFVVGQQPPNIRESLHWISRAIPT